MPENTLFTYFTREAFSGLQEPHHQLWRDCEQVSIDRYWNGKSAIREKGLDWRNLTRVRSVWNEDQVLFYFQCWFDRLNVQPGGGANQPIKGLWEKDVVEVFLRPESCEDYFEIEISPLGQWLDAHVRKPREDVNFDWDSGLEIKVAADHQEKIWRVWLVLPYQPMMKTGSLSTAPQIGEAWRLNLCRVAGEGPDREYLSWRPTFTTQPDFHVPSCFGNLLFLDSPK